MATVNKIIKKLKEHKHKMRKYVSPYKKLINYIDVGSLGDLLYPWDINKHAINTLLTFDPQEEDYVTNELIKKSTALWEKKQTKTFYIYSGHNRSGSSLFKQNLSYVKNNYEWLSLHGKRHGAITWFDRARLEKTEKIKCDALDSVLKTIKKSFHFLKIDTQGAELDILKGSKKFLKNDCLGIQAELFTKPMYMGIGMFSDVKKYLKPFGFEVAKVNPAHGTFLSQHDVLFLKKGISNRITKEIKKIYKVES